MTPSNNGRGARQQRRGSLWYVLALSLATGLAYINGASTSEMLVANAIGLASVIVVRLYMTGSNRAYARRGIRRLERHLDQQRKAAGGGDG